MQAGPLSDPITEGDVYPGMSSSVIFLTAVEVVSFLAGKTSTHPEKVSLKTRRYLYPHLPGFTPVKSTFQWTLGEVPLSCFERTHSSVG